MIIVCVPTRGRPQAAVELLQTVQETRMFAATKIVFGVDDDDPDRERYVRAIPDENLWLGPRKRMGPTLNDMASHFASQAQVIGFMGDDHRPRTHDWDLRIMQVLYRDPGVAYGNDLVHGEAIPTAAFISSSIIQALGFMAPRKLVHLELDTFWYQLGDATRRHYLPHVIIEHLHPVVGKAAWTDSYIESNSWAQQDKEELDRYFAEDWHEDRRRLQAFAS